VTPTRRWQVLCALLVLFLAGGTLLGREHHIPDRASFDSFPGVIAGFKGQTIPVSNRALAVLDLTDYLSRNYAVDGHVVNVYVGYHGHQRRGSVIHSPRHCLPGNGWYIIDRSLIPMPGQPDGPLINRMEVGIGDEKQLIYYWYQGRGRVVADEFVAVLRRAQDVALLARSDEALVRFGINGTGAEVEQKLEAFIQEVVPLLPPYLPS
jgi:EpsI family protein